jgi:hypothetical protein
MSSGTAKLKINFVLQIWNRVPYDVMK